MVAQKSVCEELAQREGVKFTKRDIFLDNLSDKNYIRTQLEKLILLAKERGEAVGIGHDRRLTLEVLKEEIPKLKAEGIEFVYLSEVVR